jgi:CheY-like chemotaxis protein
MYTYSVLIVDDSPYIRMSVSKMLRDMGFEKIEIAEDGKTGLDKFRSSNPLIVILDNIMPELDGLSILKEIKKEKPKTIVIFSSSLSVREKILEFKAAGADYYLLKPYQPLKFFEMMEKAIASLEVK